MEYYDDYLMHYGIMGMKWGVRRYQNKDGTLTPAGKKRYDNSDDGDVSSNKVQNGKLSKLTNEHRSNLEQYYISQGLSERKASVAADNRIRTEKILLAVAGVTVAACAGYAASKYVRDRTDGIIKSGEILQRIEMRDTGGKLNDIFYTSKGEHDNKRYAGLLGLTRQQQTGHAYLMKLQANGDVRVASKDKAVKAFGELFKSDPQFRRSVENHVSQHFNGSNEVNINKLSNRNIRKMYENFNANLMSIRSEGSGADQKFYGRLKKLGYGAIQDINDMKYSGYEAKNPLIVFDNSNRNILVRSVTEMTEPHKMMDNYMIELGKASVEKSRRIMTNELLSGRTAAAVTGVAGTAVAIDYNAAKNTNRVIEKYRKEHPDSKLSDKEIIDNYISNY